MKLNNEMCELAIKNEKICTFYDSEYVLLHKTMPVTDDKLEWYVEAIKSLRNAGVNISSIVDYKLVPDATRSYQNGKKQYTKGVFLEERAQGVSLDRENIYLSPRKDYDFSEVVINYLKLVNSYVEELELRAHASQDIYDKLVLDCQSIQNVGLTIDPKPLNFFFDKNLGYTIIDVIPHAGSNADYRKFFPQYVFSIVFGYGKPEMLVEFKDFSVLPQELCERLINAGQILERKIALTLRKYGYDEEEIREAIDKNKFRYANKLPNVEIEDIEDYVAQNFIAIKSETQESKKESDGFTIFV